MRLSWILQGEFGSKCFRVDHDILLNPLDARSRSWSPWSECSESYHYDELAANLIPQTSHDPFWTNAARTLFSETLLSFQDNNRSIGSLLETLTQIPLKDLAERLKATDAFPLVDPASERTAASIRATLSSAVKCLGF